MVIKRNDMSINNFQYSSLINSDLTGDLRRLSWKTTTVELVGIGYISLHKLEDSTGKINGKISTIPYFMFNKSQAIGIEGQRKFRNSEFRKLVQCNSSQDFNKSSQNI